MRVANGYGDSGVNEIWDDGQVSRPLIREWRIQSSMALSDMTVTQLVDPRQPNEAVPAHCGATKRGEGAIT